MGAVAGGDANTSTAAQASSPTGNTLTIFNRQRTEPWYVRTHICTWRIYRAIIP